MHIGRSVTHSVTALESGPACHLCLFLPLTTDSASPTGTSHLIASLTALLSSDKLRQQISTVSIRCVNSLFCWIKLIQNITS